MKIAVNFIAHAVSTPDLAYHVPTLYYCTTRLNHSCAGFGGGRFISDNFLGYEYNRSNENNCLTRKHTGNYFTLT